MPMAIPLIPLIIGAAVTGGSALFGGSGSSISSAQPDTSQQDAAAQQQALLQKKEAILKAEPGVQERLGGAVSPDFFANEVARMSGNPGDQALASQVMNLPQLLGLGSTPNTQGATAGSTFGQGGSSFTGNPSSPESSNFFEGLLPGFNLEDQGRGISGGYS